jgi:hypothetical protein
VGDLGLSDYERVVLSAAQAVAECDLGADLDRYDPGRRGTFLAAFELNHPPPIQHALRVLFTSELSRFDLRLTPADHEYLEWVQRVFALLQSMAEEWWGAIRGDIYSLLVDGDDAPPLVLLNTLFPGLRARHPTALRATAAAVGLSPSAIWRLSETRRAAQATSAYAAALRTAGDIRHNPRLRSALSAEKSRVVAELEIRRGARVDEERRRISHSLALAYDPCDPIVQIAARNLRSYNELVHASFAFLLGHAGNARSRRPVEVEPGQPIAVRFARRDFQIHLTLAQEGVPFPGGTFVIGDGGPLSGLYLTTAFGVQQLTTESPLIDLSGRRLRDLEATPEA